MGYIQVYVGWSYDTKKKKPASPPPSISKNSWTSPWTVSCKTSGVTPLSPKLEEVCIWIKIQLGMAAVVPVVSKPSNEQSVLHDSQVPKMIGLHGRCIKLHHIELDLNIYNRYKYIYIYKYKDKSISIYQFGSIRNLYPVRSTYIRNMCVCWKNIFTCQWWNPLITCILQIMGLFRAHVRTGLRSFAANMVVVYIYTPVDHHVTEP